jgi:hypothetical protein
MPASRLIALLGAALLSTCAFAARDVSDRGTMTPTVSR